MLKKFLTGKDLNPLMTAFSKRICRLVIAGNLMDEPDNLIEIIDGAYKKEEDFRNLYNKINITMKFIDT